MTTNFEEVIKVVGFASALYLLLQMAIPIIQNLLVKGIAGFILVLIMFWWLMQKK